MVMMVAIVMAVVVMTMVIVWFFKLVHIIPKKSWTYGSDFDSDDSDDGGDVDGGDDGGGDGDGDCSEVDVDSNMMLIDGDDSDDQSSLATRVTAAEAEIHASVGASG